MRHTGASWRGEASGSEHDAGGCRRNQRARNRRKDPAVETTGTITKTTSERRASRTAASEVPSTPAAGTGRERTRRGSAGYDEATATRDELIEANVPLVEHIVLRLSAGFPRHVDRSELVSAGMVGLVEAAE